jgi:hypothetical protein
MQMPVLFSPDVEVREDHEDRTQAELIETLLGISRTTLKDEHEALRAVHAKSHGLLNATLTVMEGLPPHYAQGLFARPGQYPAVLRFSAAPGDILPDTVSTHHGLGLKIRGVEGTRLAGADGDVQDFLFANGKAFNAPTAASFLKNLKLLAGTADRAEGVKVALANALRALETGLETVGAQSPKLTALGGHPAYHILAEEFFTQVPLRYGRYIAKLGIFPVSEPQKARIGEKIDLGSSFDAQRQAVRSYMATNSAAWEMRAQLCVDLEKMSVEKPDVAWPEDNSPYVTVARLDAPAQEAYSDTMVAFVDRTSSFSPWHGLVDHQPLGAINRVRRAIYDASAGFRLSRNGCPYHSAAAE